MSKRIGFWLLFVYLFLSTESFGQTKTWGSNFVGQIGDGTSGTVNNRPTPTTISGLTDVIAVGGGSSYSLVVKADGTIRSWGLNNKGQLGDGTQAQRLSPVAVLNLTSVVAVSGGDLHSLALKSDGTVWAWGNNDQSQLGNGFSDSTVPVQSGVFTSGFTNIIAIDAGLYHNLALKSDGTIWAWGNNSSGQLGIGDTIPRTVPTQITSLSNVIAIGAGQFHSAAIKSDGTIWIWGNNGAGQLGNGTSGNTPQLTPLQNTNISGVAQIAVGDRVNIALKPDGTVWAWGYNEFGQMGNGTFSATGAGCDCVKLPTQTSISNVTDIRANNSFHTLARKKDGSIWAWGYNAEGEVGNGTISPQLPDHYSILTPTQTSVGTGNVIFGTGRQHSLLSAPIVPTAVGANVAVRLGEATVTFGNVTTGGTTTITAVDPNAIGAPPPTGFVVQSNTQAYDISTTAVFSGSATVCIKFPTIFDQTQFSSLRLLHGEGGVLVDRTTTRNYQTREICGSVSSLSPFVIAINNSPTAASVSVGGRVFSGKGRGLGSARVTLTDASGQTQTATTNPFGYYRFDEVAAGETYVLSVAHKRYYFAPQVVSVMEELTELNFTAEP